MQFRSPGDLRTGAITMGGAGFAWGQKHTENMEKMEGLCVTCLSIYIMWFPEAKN